MKQLEYLVILLASMCCLTSCKWLINSPKADKESIEFTALGGEKIVNIIKFNGEVYQDKASWWIWKPKDSKAKIDTLNDGRIKYSEDWVDFIVTPDKKNIRVVASENKTGAYRETEFHGHSNDALNFTIYVRQRAE